MLVEELGTEIGEKNSGEGHLEGGEGQRGDSSAF